MCYAHEESRLTTQITFPISNVKFGESDVLNGIFKTAIDKYWKVYAKNGKNNVYFELNLKEKPYFFKMFNQNQELELEIEKALKNNSTFESK